MGTKKILLLGSSLIIVLILIFSYEYSSSSGNKLEVDFLDVGQGDSILIKSPAGENILIDGGPDNKVIKRLSENLPIWDRRIDLMILTHPHDDHVTGLVEVLKRYDVKKIAATGVVHSTPNYISWLELIRDKKIPFMVMDRPQTLELGSDCRLEFIYPLGDLSGKEADNLNNTSIVAKLIYGKNSFLFMGDAEALVEKELIKRKADLSADVLKVGHHGSDTASSENFLKAVKPESAMIEVGLANQFGHPSRRVLKRLERVNAKVFRTDEQGTIKVFSDGQHIKVAD